MPMLQFDEQFIVFDVTPLENLFVDEYMLRAPGNFVKVYIYALRQCYHPPRENDYERMAKDLCMDEDDVKRAFAYWERQGLLSRISDNPPTYRFYNLKAKLMQESTGDDGLYRYREFNDRVQGMFSSGRLLHAGDTKYLYDWIEVYKLPEKVVLILVEYLLKKRGPKVSFANCDNIAKDWADRGINTEEAAREQVRYSTDSFILTKKVLHRLGINSSPSPDQERLYRSWLDMGFDNAAILECCKQTTSARSPNMGYLDTIIQDMHARGLHTVKEISGFQDEFKSSMGNLRQIYSELGLSMPTAPYTMLDTYRKWIDMGFGLDAILTTARALKRTDANNTETLGRTLSQMKEKGIIEDADVSRYYDEIFTFQAIAEELVQRLGEPRKATKGDREEVQRWRGVYGMSTEMIMLAADCAREGRGKKFALMEAIIKSWNENGITTVAQAQRFEEERRARQPQTQNYAAKTPSRAPVADFARHEYAPGELENVYTDIMNEEDD